MIGLCLGAGHSVNVGGEGPAGEGQNRIRQDWGLQHPPSSTDSRHQGRIAFNEEYFNSPFHK